MSVASLFQSSPTPKGGRYDSSCAPTYSEFRFNPHPPRRVGATRRTADSLRSGRVSILTHPEGWALQGMRILRQIAADVSILTHPEGWALRSSSRKDRAAVRVSILTHPEGWALPLAAGNMALIVEVSILTHPEGWALHTRGTNHRTEPMFQSSPTPKGGRYIKWMLSLPLVICFNPHPPRRVGATARMLGWS